MIRSISLLVLLWICTQAPQVMCATNLFALNGNSITLECPLEPVSEIQWFDWVYNVDTNPAVIYQDGMVTTDEYHGERFTVDTNTKALTISDLKDDDAGMYFCKVGAGDDAIHEMNLILTAPPVCADTRGTQGVVQGLVEGDVTELHCSMEYLGQMTPKLDWFWEEMMLDDSVDRNSIGIAQEIITINVTNDMNNNTFTCQSNLHDIVVKCSIIIEVQYPAHKPQIVPELYEYTPGDTVSCVSQGNPVPDVTLTLTDHTLTGLGQVEFVIPAEWAAMTYIIQCTASNEVEGIRSSETILYEIAVPENNFNNTNNTNKETASEGTANIRLPALYTIAIGLLISVIVPRY